MILRYRVLGADRTSHVDLELEAADDVTLGELARAVAAHLGRPAPADLTLSPAGDGTTWSTAPERPARTHAPACGSTVELACRRRGPAPPRLLSPVSVDLDDGTRLRFGYGPTELTPGVVVDVGTTVSVRRTDPSTPVTVDGARALGTTRVRSGSLLGAGGRAGVVRVDGALSPPIGGPLRPHPRRRALAEPVPAMHAVPVPTPPGAHRVPGLPVLTAVVPLLMGAALWAATRSVAVLGFVLFSFVFVVAAAVEARREVRAEVRFRVDEFRRDLDDACTELARHHDDERRRLESTHPPAAEVAGWSRRPSERLWCRVAGAGALDVRIGRSTRPGTTRAALADGGRRDLRAEATRRIEAVDRVELPATVDLSAVHHLALVGPDESPAAAARALLVQLCGLLGPDDLAVELAVGDDRAPAWRWASWLPHRTDAPGRGTARARVVVVDGDDLGGAAALAGTASEPTVVVLWIASGTASVPDVIGSRVVLEPSPGCGDVPAVLVADGERRSLVAETLGVDVAEAFARATARLVPAGDPSPRPDGGALPGGVTLRDVLGDPARLDDPDRLARAWRRPVHGLGVPLGRAADGVVALDLVADGPHAILAGTTGSGKSELLRTLLVSAALHHPPDRLTFLLVDYKGGTAFGDLVDLPHSVGLVTDLTPVLAERVLVSLGAELRRREAAEAASATGSPALVVVVDEFATLVDELPAFVDGVVDLARRGRSLGIHLVLATQRPAGVVTDAIRANTSIRIALRVADPDDSTDVVGSPVAATLPRSLPGRAVVRVGTDPAVAVQAAYSAAPSMPTERIRCRPLRPGPPPPTPPAPAGGEPQPTQLGRAVATARRAAGLLGIGPPRRPWQDPLPRELALEPAMSGSDGSRLCVGLVDRPELQDRVPFEVDLDRRGGLLVVGATGSGRTTALAACAVAAIGAGHRVVGIEAGRSLDGVVPTVGVEDAERTLRLLRRLRRELADRLATGGTSPGAGRDLVLVDGIGTFVDAHERINRGEAIDLLGQLARDGRAAGIHLVVAAGRRSEVPAPVLAGLDHRLVLRCSSPEDADTAGAPATVADPRLPPGRGVTDGHWVQVARPDPGAVRAGADRPAVGSLPRSVDAATLPGPVAGHPWAVHLGLSGDTLLPVPVDLSGGHLLITGPPRSGRSSAAALLADQLGRSDPAPTVVAVDGRSADPVAVVDVFALVLEAREPTVLVVDELADLLDGPGGDAADDVLTAVLRGNAAVRVVATAEADALARCYATSVRLLRAARRGLLLRPDPDLHPPLLHASLPLHDELEPAPGRGWLVGTDPDAGPVAIQLAHSVSDHPPT